MKYYIHNTHKKLLYKCDELDRVWIYNGFAVKCEWMPYNLSDIAKSHFTEISEEDLFLIFL